MKNHPKMPFFASKYFFLLDGSRLFFKLYMIWNMHSIHHEQYKMSLNYHHLAKCSFSSFKLAKMAKFYFSIKKKKIRVFWDPHNSPKNPPIAFFYTFIRISFLFPFILYSSQHFIGVILLIFFDVFRNLAPKWPFF